MKSLLFLLCFLVASVGFATAKYDMVVSLDGSGDFSSIQKAIDATKAFPPQRITIFIKNGTYNEKVKVHSWNTDLTLFGESADSTIITFNDYFDKINLGRNSTFHTYTLLVNANDFVAENLTIANTSGPVGQAVALHVEADRCVFKNIRILGHQDALYAAGINCRQLYQNCYIEGTTDFIFGAATAYFEHCTVHSLSNSFVTAASTPEGMEFGYVFYKCRLTSAIDVNSVYLGRPWRPYAKTVFIKCELGSHIRPEGWKEWSNNENKQTTYYAEFNSTGPGAQPSKRADWTHQLSKKEVKKYVKEIVLKTKLTKEDIAWMQR